MSFKHALQKRKLPEKGQSREWKSINSIEKQNGGKVKLKEKLELSRLSPPLQKFVELLSMPEYAQDSLVNLCKMSGVMPFDLLEAMHQGFMDRHIAAAHEVLGEQLQGIASDVGRKAIDHVRACGCTMTLTGTKASDSKCPSCAGRGYLFKEGSIEHAELALKTAGAMPKAEGTKIENKVNVLNAPGNASSIFDAFVKAADAPQGTMIVAPKIIDVEVVPSDT